MQKPWTLVTLLTLWALSWSCMARDVTADLSPPKWYTLARQAIEVKNYDLAIQVLTQTPDQQSADWHNLMGFSLRLKTPPQWGPAEQHYRSALEINPLHLGALEYYGELLLMKNDLPGAQTLLDRLKKACAAGCEELSDLEKSVAAHKAQQ